MNRESIVGLVDEIIIKGDQMMFSSPSSDLYSFISPSAYDTAWLAMIPDHHYSNYPHIGSPMFPNCLDWVLDNQKEEGFWGEPHHHSNGGASLECLCATLACMVALKTWNAGNTNIHKGLEFINENVEKVVKEQCGNLSPRWFTIIFPAMLQLSETVGLQVFPQGFTETVKQIFTQREKILSREAVFDKSKYPPLLSYLEALPIISINDGIIKEERLLEELSEDGSLFQSPSATARAFMLTGNESCRIYLESMVKRCGHGVPCTYPFDEQVVQLCMVDHLERLGLAPHFSEEIQHVLGSIYRDWIKCKPRIMEEYIKPEQIYKDSLAFRLFRMHGYHVSPWKICWILQQKNIFVHMEENYESFLSALLNVYKATNLIFPGEDELEEIRSYSRKLLEKGISTKIFTTRIDQFTNLQKEIGHELGLPWLARLDYLEHRIYIEESDGNDLCMGKAPFYRLSYLNNTGLRQLARENYSLRQLIYREELEELKRWSKDSGLLEMGFAREKTAYCYFAIAASTSLPYLSDIRKIVVKSAVLITIIDDLFDMEGSLDELYSFTEAVKRWDAEGICGRNKVIFDALDDLVDEISLKFFREQGWDITEILRDIWYHTFLSWLKEVEWSELGITPSIEEYIEVGMTSIAVHTIILPIYYLITQDLAKYMMHHSQYEMITKLLMVSTRLLNDLQSYKKEMEDGKKNLVILYMMEKPGSTIEEAINYVRDALNEVKKELLQNILLDDMSNMPKQFKQLHLSCLKVFQMFFNSTNGYDSETEFLLNIKKAICDPLKEVKVQRSLPLLSPNQHEEPEMGISREKPQLTRSFNYSHVGKKSIPTRKNYETTSEGSSRQLPNYPRVAPFKVKYSACYHITFKYPCSPCFSISFSKASTPHILSTPRPFF